jgi:hypothetical protein
MDAKSILAEYYVPDEMRIDYVFPFRVEPSSRFVCTDGSNELWKLIAVLHIVDRTNLRAQEIEFSTHCKELLELSNDIETLYGFLTGKSIRIRIMVTPPKSVQQRIGEPKPSGSLVLFSGGVDSLAAAVSTTEKVPSLLFHATTSNVIMSKASDLRYASSRLLRTPIAYGDCRFSSLGGGFSQTRGLLFLAAATNAAANLGVNQIIIGENGPLMINPLVSPASISTKNAHPKLIVGFQEIMQKLGYRGMHLVAPHKDMTKTEVILDALQGLQDTIMKSYSCWRTQGLSAMCGVCFSCYVRKLSLLAAGIDEPDSLYEDDPFTLYVSESTSESCLRDLMDLKDSLTYYKRFAIGSDIPLDWKTDLPPNFFEDPTEMLQKFALDLFVGVRGYFRRGRLASFSTALGKYSLDAIGEIGQSKLDSRESELGKRVAPCRTDRG